MLKDNTKNPLLSILFMNRKERIFMLIEVQNLTKKYGEKFALSNVNLKINEGQLLHILELTELVNQQLSIF